MIGDNPSNGKLQFLSPKAKGPASIAVSDTIWYTWNHIGRVVDPQGGYCLKVGMSGSKRTATAITIVALCSTTLSHTCIYPPLSVYSLDKVIRISGFKESDFKKLADWLQIMGHELMKEEVTVRGRNWGEFDVENEIIKFKNEDRTVFDIPLQFVSQTVAQGKNEVRIRNRTIYQLMTALCSCIMLCMFLICYSLCADICVLPIHPDPN